MIYEIITGRCLFNYGGGGAILGQMQETLGEIPDKLRCEWGIRPEDVRISIPFIQWYPRLRPLSLRIRERLSAVISKTTSLAEAIPIFSDKEHELLVDLIGKMLKYDPSERITAKEALRHLWFSVESS